MPTLHPDSTNPPLATFDSEAVANPTPTSATTHALDRAPAADRAWRELRRSQLETQLVRGRWLHRRLINPLISALGTISMIPLVRLAQSPAGIGVDLSSDWSLAQWCIRYVVCLAVMFFPQLFVHHWVSRRFARWEARLRQELGPPDPDRSPEETPALPANLSPSE